MALGPEQMAKSAEIGGSVLAASCGACKWLADNHDLLANFGILFGFLIAGAGFFVNVYYRDREDRRREERHALELSIFQRRRADDNPNTPITNQKQA